MPIIREFDPATAPWPVWVVVASLFRAESDRGVGDTMRRELGGLKSERFKRHHELVFGLWAAPCSCPAKLRELNRLYAYHETGIEGGLSAGKPAV